MKQSTILAGALLAAMGLSAQAATIDTEPSRLRALVDKRVIEDVRSLIDVPVTQLSVATQNQRHADLDQASVDALDQQWRAERDADDKPLIASVLMNPLSFHLLKVQADSLGLFTEIFVMDAVGLNVGQSAVTSDYWQGDEAKFQKTFPVGPDTVFVDEAEYHEASGTWRAQLNIAVAAEDGATAIGAATIEINLTELARRHALAKGY